MRYFLIVFVSLLFGTCACWAADKPALQDENDKICYSIGYQVGTDLKEHGVKPNAPAMTQGLQDAFDPAADTLLSAEEMQAVLVAFKMKIDARQQQQQQGKKAVEQYRGEGRAFLSDNAKKEGVVTLPSGLQYLVLAQGSGKTPKPEDTVTVNYRGTLINGREFDSSFRDNKPATFRVDTVILGWQEALAMMKEGDKWKLFIPSDLAFGERGPLADKVVIYELELLSVLPAQEL